MTAFSLGTVWEETIAFLRRESGLLIPVALAVYGPAQVLLAMGMEHFAAFRAAGAQAGPPDPRGLLILPGMLMLLFGNLATSLLVLTPGISVAEALTGALKRMPKMLSAMVLMFAGMVGVGIVLIVVATLASLALGAQPGPDMVGQLSVLLFVPLFLVFIRMLPIMAVIAREDIGGVEAIRRSWTLGRGNVLRLFGAWLLMGFIGLIIALVEYFAIGSLIGLLKLAVGDGGLVFAIETIVNAAIESVLSLGVAIYIALVYRKLAGF